jgi:hypothetical protein
MKDIKKRTSSLLMIAVYLSLLSSCGISWENYDQAAGINDNIPGKEISFGGVDQGTQINLRSLSFNTPQRPLNFSTRIIFNFSDHQSSLKDTTVEVRHEKTGRRMFKADASSLIGESFSFSIPMDLMGDGSRDYQVIQSSGNDVIVTSLNIGADNSALYVFK